MKTYRVSWQKGRRAGAIGIFYPGNVVVKAINTTQALDMAYDTHEHLMNVNVTELDESNVD